MKLVLPADFMLTLPQEVMGHAVISPGLPRPSLGWLISPGESSIPLLWDSSIGMGKKWWEEQEEKRGL